MGLDCTAYSHLKFVGKHTDGFCHEENDEGDRLHRQAFAYPGFEKSMDGLPILENVRGYGDTEFLWGGCYQKTDETEVYGFHAGSYSGYNQWRLELANQFNPYLNQKFNPAGRLVDYDPPDPDKPFAELIWFADNEGTIGPLAAARLLVDFKDHEVEYRLEHTPADLPEGEEPYDVERYLDWMKACELASQDGLIDFH